MLGSGLKEYTTSNCAFLSEDGLWKEMGEREVLFSQLAWMKPGSSALALVCRISAPRGNSTAIGFKVIGVEKPGDPGRERYFVFLRIIQMDRKDLGSHSQAGGNVFEQCGIIKCGFSIIMMPTCISFLNSRLSVEL